MILTLLLLPSLGSVIMLLVWAAIACIVIGVIYWLVTTFIPAPVQKYAIAVLVVLSAIFVIYLLLSFAGGGIH